MDMKGISPELFYGPPSFSQLQIERMVAKGKHLSYEKKMPGFLSRLLGPSKTWKVFKKQVDAISYAKKRGNGLMCFSFQQANGDRLFLTVHPVFFWYVYCKRSQNERNSYEIIQEFAVSKLYLDIEYDIHFNPNHNGERMLTNFLNIINYNLNDRFGVLCDSTDILDLDSTTSEKFSHHIIYQLRNAAFQDNYAVGNFVKLICLELRQAKEENKIKTLAEKYDIPVEDIIQFFIIDRKGKETLFVDECVYTKNRHFRILGSTKCHKNSPLVVSKNNRYNPRECQYGDVNLQIFLDSLITYFSSEPIDIINDPSCTALKVSSNSKPLQIYTTIENENDADIDEFVRSIIFPKGKVRRKIYFNTSNLIVYEILNYRYCYNIGREHKSNNIKLIVDMNKLVYYQKCYDPECCNFKSNDIPLPDRIKFLYEDDSKFVELCNTVEIQDFIFCSDENNKIMDEVEDIALIKHEEQKQKQAEKFPDYGIKDSEMLNICISIEEFQTEF